MEKSSFFTSLNGDRRYKASDFAEYFSTFIGNGVFPNPSSNLIVTSNSDMTINVAAGFGWINGYMYNNTDDLVLTVSAADGVLSRIDRVVLRCDFINREIRSYIKPGVFSQTPTAPSLTRNNDYYEICIAEINIEGGSSSISQADITDTRLNSELCGVVTQTVNEIDTTELYRKLEAYIDERGQDISGWIDVATSRWEIEFITWFETIKGILDQDVAGNLTNRIIALENKVGNGLVAEGVSISDANNNFTSTNVEGALLEIANEQKSLKLSVVNGKTAIAGAISDRGVPTPADATFDTMKNNIMSIKGLPSGWDREESGVARGLISQGDAIVFSKGADGSLTDMNNSLLKGIPGKSDNVSITNISCMSYGGTSRKFLMLGAAISGNFLHLYEYMEGQYMKFPALGSFTNMNTISDITIDRGGNRLITVGATGYIHGFTIGEATVSSIFTSQGSDTYAKRRIACNPTNNHCYVVGETANDNIYSVHILATDTGTGKGKAPNVFSTGSLSGYLSNVYVHPQGDLLTISGLDEKSKKIFQYPITDNGATLGSVIQHTTDQYISGLCMHPRTGNLYIGYVNGVLEVRNGRTLEVIHTQNLGTTAIRAVTIDQDAVFIAYIKDGRIYRGKLNSNETINESSIISIAPSDDFSSTHLGVSHQLTLGGQGDILRKTITSTQGIPYMYNASLEGDRLKPVFKIVRDVYKDMTTTSSLGATDISISPDNKFLAYTRNEAGPFGVMVINDDGTFGTIPDLSGMVGGSSTYVHCKISNDSKYLFVTATSSPYLLTYSVEFNGIDKDIPYTFTKLPNPTVIPAGLGYCVDYSADDKVIFGVSNAPYSHMYSHLNGILTKYPDYQVFNSTPMNLQFSPVHRVYYMATNTASSGAVSVSYNDTSHGSGVGTSSYVRVGLRVSPSGKYIATGKSTTGGIDIWTTSEEGMKLTLLQTFTGLSGNYCNCLIWINDELLLLASSGGVHSFVFNSDTQKFDQAGLLNNLDYSYRNSRHVRADIYHARNGQSFLLIPNPVQNRSNIFVKVPLKTINTVSPLTSIKMIKGGEIIGISESSGSTGDQVNVALFDKLKI